MTGQQNHIMIPPGNGKTSNVNGRTYSASSGGTVSAPDSDANALEANGWIRATNGGSGPTTARPKTLPNGQPINVGFVWNDTTLGYPVMWTGTIWAHPQSGASS